MRLRTTVFPLVGVCVASSRVTSPTRCRMVKKLKLQEGLAVIPCRRRLTTGRVLRSWGDQGRHRGSAGKGERMERGRILAYITGTADQELLLRNKYLVAESRILKVQLQGRPRLSDAERAKLGEMGLDWVTSPRRGATLLCRNDPSAYVLRDRHRCGRRRLQGDYADRTRRTLASLKTSTWSRHSDRADLTNPSATALARGDPPRRESASWR
jgi:hypothetical protein